MGEHSPCDALVPSVVAEYAIVQGIESEAFDSHDAEVGFVDIDMADDAGQVSAANGKEEGWEKLEWVTDEYIARECMEAGRRAKDIIVDSDDSVLWFAEYGADWMKSVGVLPIISILRHPTIRFCLFLLVPHYLTVWRIHSPTLPGRIHPDGTPTRMVQVAGHIHRDVRDRTNKAV